MRHKVTSDTNTFYGEVFAQPSCTCGWLGDRFAVSEPTERSAYDRQVTGHRSTVFVTRGLSCFMGLTALLWLGVIVLGVGWLFSSHVVMA